MFIIQPCRRIGSHYKEYSPIRQLPRFLRCHLPEYPLFRALRQYPRLEILLLGNGIGGWDGDIDWEEGKEIWISIIRKNVDIDWLYIYYYYYCMYLHSFSLYIPSYFLSGTAKGFTGCLQTHAQQKFNYKSSSRGIFIIFIFNRSTNELLSERTGIHDATRIKNI